MRFKKKYIKILLLLCIAFFILPTTTIRAMEATQIDLLVDDTNVSNSGISNQTLVILITIAVVLFLLFLFFLIKFIMKSKQLKNTKELQEKLKSDYESLENTYDEVTNIYKELIDKYDTLKESDEKNEKLAYTNSLTELPNRNALMKKLDQIVLTLRKEETVALMYIDLDNFKQINDALGHAYGDELLIDVSHRIKQVIDENDVLTHFGGDEFIIITQNITDISEYEDKIKKVQKLFSYPFTVSQKEIFITISIGITMAPKDGKTSAVLIKNVDLAMYLAKKRGKNTYCYFDKAINERFMEKMELQAELNKSVSNEEFEVFYQPVVDTLDQSIKGFEALVRWNHPERGIIGPSDFVKLAEETGLIVPIGEFVLREACMQWKLWNDMGYEALTLSVNISARQLSDAKFVTMVENIIEESGIDPTYLQLEVTENIALDNIEFVIDVMERLIELGVTFAYDDFGIGTASINYLRDLPVKVLKIDQSYIEVMLYSEENKKIVNAVVKFAHTLGVTVVGEGVETIEQLNYLKEVGCDKVQGYYFSEPITKNNANKLLANWFGAIEHDTIEDWDE